MGINFYIIDMVSALCQLIFIIHLTANLYSTVANFNIDSADNWEVKEGVRDDSFFYRYLASMYLAVVTATTVGYGDIIPTNTFEKILAIFVIVGGVSAFSIV